MKRDPSSLRCNHRGAMHVGRDALIGSDPKGHVVRQVYWCGRCGALKTVDPRRLMNDGWRYPKRVWRARWGHLIAAKAHR
jgi:hypothetical protein